MLWSYEPVNKLLVLAQATPVMASLCPSNMATDFKRGGMSTSVDVARFLRLWLRPPSPSSSTSPSTKLLSTPSITSVSSSWFKLHNIAVLSQLPEHTNFRSGSTAMHDTSPSWAAPMARAFNVHCALSPSTPDKSAVHTTTVWSCDPVMANGPWLPLINVTALIGAV